METAIGKLARRSCGCRHGSLRFSVPTSFFITTSGLSSNLPILLPFDSVPSGMLPPPRSVLDGNQHDGADEDPDARHQDRRPSETDGVQQRIHKRDRPGGHPAPHEVHGGRGRPGAVAIEVDDEGAQGREGARHAKGREEEENDGAREGGTALHDPAVGNDGRGSDVDERQNDLEASGFDGEVGQILLFGFGDFHAARFGVATEIPVDEPAHDKGSRHAAQAGWNVTEADLQRVEVVLFPKLGRHAGEDHVQSCKECAGVEDDHARFLFKNDIDRFERVGAGFEARCRFPLRGGTGLALLAQMQVGQD